MLDSVVLMEFQNLIYYRGYNNKIACFLQEYFIMTEQDCVLILSFTLCDFDSYCI